MSDLSYAKYVVTHNPNNVPTLKKQLSIKGFKPHGIEKSVWRKVLNTKRGDIMAVKSKYHQTGRSIKRIDRKIHAKRVGKRKSASGKVYYERRANRSDVKKWL